MRQESSSSDEAAIVFNESVRGTPGAGCPLGGATDEGDDLPKK